MSIHKVLSEIQAALKAPKNQRNNFGNYNYRSCEDILEAVKPLASGNGCSVTLSDSMELIGDRVYVRATATLSNSADESVGVTAYAREPLSRKGMDDSQITGSASSYARKYALNGLFAIDDTKDADHDNKGAGQPQTITAAQEDEILQLAKDVGADVSGFMKWLKVGKMSELRADKFDAAIAALERKRNENNQ